MDDKWRSSDSDQWTVEEIAALKERSVDRPVTVLNRIEPRRFAPTTTLRWYQAQMTPENQKVLQQLWVDVMAGAKEWREIETVDES